MILTLLSALAAAACPAPTTSAELELAAEDAESAFRQMDVEAFRAADAQVETLLGCLAEPLPVPVAARLHRLAGLAAFVAQDAALAPLAFAAARSVEPDYLLPTSLVPTGHPIQTLYTSVPLDARVPVTLPAPAQGYLLLDGRRALERAEGWPVIVQLLDDTGQVRLTDALRPGEPMPTYPVAGPMVEPVAATPSPLTDTPPPPTIGPSRAGIALVATSAAAAMATGGLYLLSWRSLGNYRETTTVDAANSLRKRTNTLEYAAWGAGAVAIGAGVGAAVSLRW